MYLDQLISQCSTVEWLKALESFNHSLLKSFMWLPELVSLSPNSSLCSSVEWLVVDESDRLFEDGQRGFREQLATIYQACTAPSVTQALFSATFAQSVQDWCRLNLHNMAMVTVGLRYCSVLSPWLLCFFRLIHWFLCLSFLHLICLVHW